MPIIIRDTRDEVIKELGSLIKKIADERTQSDGEFKIGVSGGSVADFLTICLPKIETDFSRWKIFFCDERVVSESDADSTFGLYKSNLLGVVNIKENQFVKLKQGLAPKEAADDYASQIATHFPGCSLPRFDLLLLGMGPDGHTCSLFPGHKLLEEKERWIEPITDSPKPPPNRITMTFPVINNSRNCVFAISGKGKANVVKKILADKEDLPSARVKPTSGNLYWILDRAAASELDEKTMNS